MRNYILILRPRHWIKNLLLFAAPFFGGVIFVKNNLVIGIPAFLAFSMMSSAIYIFNDLKDVDFDLNHPKKKRRPIAAGVVRKDIAAGIALILFAASMILSCRLSTGYLLYVALYASIQAAYTLFIRQIAILDIFSIAMGFVIRVAAGGAVFSINPSGWLIVTMFMIALVLAAGKRLAEVLQLGERAAMHRKGSLNYSEVALNEFLIISCSCALMSYALYAIDQYNGLIYTVPVAMLGLFRYLLLAKHGIGDPTDALTKDRILAAIVIFWLMLIGFIRYGLKYLIRL